MQSYIILFKNCVSNKKYFLDVTKCREHKTVIALAQIVLNRAVVRVTLDNCK